MSEQLEKTIPVIERSRCPSHPGEILKGMYLDELQITITQFARDIDVSRKAVSAIVNCRKSITAEMALRISKAVETSPQLWLNLQANYDLWQAAHSGRDFLKNIKPVAAMV